MIPFLPLIHSALGGGNQFASGGLLLMAVGTIGASMRRVPSQLFDFFERKMTLRATITDETAIYPYFVKWLRSKYPEKRMRKLLLQSVYSRRDEKRSFFFGLGEGNHWFWYKDRPLMIHVEKAEVDKAVRGGYEEGSHRPETITLRCLGRDKAYLESILEEAASLREEDTGKGRGLYVLDNGGWTRIDGKISRPLSSVILPGSSMATIKRDIQAFLDSKDWYANAGIPYHLGLLFHGLPGTGKSSLVEGLAHEFKRDIYLMNLASVADKDLPSLFAELTPGSFLLMEDVDCVQAAARRDKKKGKEESSNGLFSAPTLSGLLNVLDGLQAPDGVIYFMTTNHRDKLDPALIRPGRIDMQFEFGAATEDQAKKIYRVFNPDEATAVGADLFADSHVGKTMAELQMVLMQGRNVQMTTALEIQ